MNDLPTLPASWAWDRASNVCLKIQDGTHFSPKNQHPSGQYRYVTAKNIRPWGMDLSDITYLDERDHRTIYERCDPKKGDVLLVKDGVNTGDAALNTLDEEFSLLSSVCMLRPDARVLEGAFLRYFLQSPIGYNSLTGQMSGTAIKRIVLHRIRGLPVPVAPLPEQRRIVAEIETQFTRLDAAVAALERARANLKRYRLAVVAMALRGQLDGVAPASEWRWVQFSDLIKLMRNGLSTKPDADAGTPILRISSVRARSVDFNDVRYLPSPIEEVADFVLEPGDLLFTRYNGNPNLVGVCGMVREIPTPTVHPDKLIRVRVADTSSVLPEFLEIALNFGASREHIMQRVRTTAGQSGISGGDLRSAPVPLPTVDDQKSIVEEVDRLFSVAQAIEATILANYKRAERMRQSILRKAFAGQLVPQDPADEPASVLLDRI